MLLLEGNSIQFRYQAGNRPVHVLGKSSASLADNNWHSVYIERNRFEFFIKKYSKSMRGKPILSLNFLNLRKGARVVIDGNEKREVREPPGPILALYLTSPLSIGKNEASNFE